MTPTSSTCLIKIRGSFDGLWSEYLGDMVLRVDVEADEVCITMLYGKPPDLAAFIGMLSLLADFSIPVLACEYVLLEREKPSAHPP